MMPDYMPAAHYWIVASDEDRVWSTADAAYVAPDDEAYAAWLADGGRVTRIASEAELQAVLVAAGCPERGPAYAPVVDYGAFRARWTAEEREALHAARQSDWRVDDFVGLAQAQGHINIGGSVAPQAKALFVALGVLTAERADVVFAA